jgi:TPR repeat protein
MKNIAFIVFASIIFCLGCSESHYERGKQFYRDANYHEAFKHCLKSAQSGYAPAQNEIGSMYYNGLGCAKDYGQAKFWFNKALKQKDPKAAHNLGLMYLYGHGVKENHNSAFQFFKFSAIYNDFAEAQSILGKMYYHGDGVDQDYREAFKWSLKAANNGVASAQNDVGIMYLKGIGIDRDYSNAFKYFTEASKNNFPAAWVNMALMCRNGLGVDKDENKALECLKNAASTGYAPALNGLAWFWAEKNDNLDEAKKNAEKAVEKEPDNGNFIDTLGWILFKQCQYEVSIEQLAKASKLKPDSAEIKNHLGDVYLAIGKNDMAKEQWDEAVSLTNDNDLKNNIQKKLDKLVIGIDEP